LTEGPAGEAHAMWMRDWPISWQGGWSKSLESLVCLDFLWACFCEHGQTSDTYIALFTLGLMWLIRPQVIKSIKNRKYSS